MDDPIHNLQAALLCDLCDLCGYQRLTHTKRETRLQRVRPPATTGTGKGKKSRGHAKKTIRALWGKAGLREFQTFSVSTSFRRGGRMDQVGGEAGRPADMAKSSEWRTEIGRF